MQVFCFQPGGRLPDKTDAPGMGVDCSHFPGSPGDEFIRDAPGSGKQIEDDKTFQVDKAVKDIEQAFFCKIGGRANREP
jgi:hypothetical protein